MSRDQFEYTIRPMGQRAAQVANPPSAPLVPITLGMTTGIVADRVVGISIQPAGTVFGLGVLIWLACARSRSQWSVIGLSLACAALGALHHRQYCTVFPADDIGQIAKTDAALIHLRGVLADEPERRYIPRDPLRSIPRRTPRAPMWMFSNSRMRMAGWPRPDAFE